MSVFKMNYVLKYSNKTDISGICIHVYLISKEVGNIQREYFLTPFLLATPNVFHFPLYKFLKLVLYKECKESLQCMYGIFLIISLQSI